MIDRELVTRKIVLISGDLEELRKFDSAGLEAYLVDPYKEILAERFLERMISRMIDVNYHVITGSGHPPPRDYYDSFTGLGKMGILEPKFASGIARAQGFATVSSMNTTRSSPKKSSMRSASLSPTCRSTFRLCSPSSVDQQPHGGDPGNLLACKPTPIDAQKGNLNYAVGAVGQASYQGVSLFSGSSEERLCGGAGPS